MCTVGHPQIPCILLLLFHSGPSPPHVCSHYYSKSLYLPPKECKYEAGNSNGDQKYQLFNIHKPIAQLASQRAHFFFLRATPKAYGSSSFGVKIKAAAEGYTSAKLDPSCICNLYHSSQQCQILTHWVRPGIEPAFSWRPHWVLNPLSHSENSQKLTLEPSSALSFVGRSVQLHWLQANYARDFSGIQKGKQDTAELKTAETPPIGHTSVTLEPRTFLLPLN